MTDEAWKNLPAVIAAIGSVIAAVVTPVGVIMIALSRREMQEVKQVATQGQKELQEVKQAVKEVVHNTNGVVEKLGIAKFSAGKAAGKAEEKAEEVIRKENGE